MRLPTHRGHLQFTGTRVAVVAGLLSALATAPSFAQEAAGWKALETKNGISVSEREVGGDALPIYRGKTRVTGPISEVLGVILDDTRSKEWAKDVSEAKVLRVVDGTTTIVYSRSEQPWPVRDRDMVMKRTVEVVEPGTVYRVKLTCLQQEKPEVAKVVRIRDCESSFVLRKVDDSQTDVEFQMRVEPGGNHPEWAVRRASKSVPYDTLSGLRKQVQRTRGQYDETLQRYGGP